jgi:hypothetical protein
MKTWEEIKVEEALNEEDFTTLVSASPLTPTEIENIPTFFKLYARFLEAGSTPFQGWMALRNIIILKRAQDEFNEKNPVQLRQLPEEKESGKNGWHNLPGNDEPVAPIT